MWYKLCENEELNLVKTYRGETVIRINYPERVFVCETGVNYVTVVDSEKGTIRELTSFLKSKSPRGRFAWGYYGVLPVNLAYSILSDLVNHSEPPTWIVKQFVKDQISRFGKTWDFTEEELIEYLGELFENGEEYYA